METDVETEEDVLQGLGDAEVVAEPDLEPEPEPELVATEPEVAAEPVVEVEAEPEPEPIDETPLLPHAEEAPPVAEWPEEALATDSWEPIFEAPPTVEPNGARRWPFARRTADLEPVVEALVRPAAELADSGWRGRCCLLIIAELTGEDRAQYSRELQDVVARTGGNEVFALLTERTGFLTDALRTERFALMVMFILRAIADRARLLERRTRHGRPQLDHEPFLRNLVAMATASMAAPGAR